MEVSWIDSHEDVMRLEERWLAHSLAAVAARHGAEIERLLGVEIKVPTLPFPRLTFAQARALLYAAGTSLAKQDDLDPESERRVSAHVAAEYRHEFVFITEYPASGRAFYHMRYDDRGA
jgi:aspartyl/asparaginyl-tRNA synthetase